MTNVSHIVFSVQNGNGATAVSYGVKRTYLLPDPRSCPHHARRNHACPICARISENLTAVLTVEKSEETKR